MSSRRQADGKAPWLRLTGMGVELAGAVIGFTLVGLWIDRRYETEPWGLLVCAILGLIGGLYNLIRTSLSILKPPDYLARNPTHRSKR